MGELRRIARRVLDRLRRLRAQARAAGREVDTGRILTVQTDLTNFCNLRCRMCYFHAGSPEVKERLDYDEFCRRFDPIAPRIRSFGLSCAAEPLVAREEDLVRIFRWVRERGIPHSFMVTNGVLLRPRLAESFIDAGLSQLQVSIDSHLKEDFEAIRLGARFETVVKNVRYFTEYRRSRNLTTPELQVNCVLMRRNIEHVGPFLDFIHELGADLVDFRHLVVYQGFELDSESLVHHKELANEALALIRQKCKHLGIRIANIPDSFHLESPPPAEGEAQKPVCAVPKTFMYVRPSGEVQPCCFWFGEEPVGNLAKDGFEAVWSDPSYSALREDTARGVFTRRCCRTCPSVGGGSVDDASSFDEKAYVPEKSS